jgi:hypothetical protein
MQAVITPNSSVFTIAACMEEGEGEVANVKL